MPQNNLKWGDWNAICDCCGFKFKASELRERWDGLMVCPEDWESRHPQDFLRVRGDNPSVPWTRPESDDEFIQICYLWGISAYADLGEADCMQADNNFLPYKLLKALKDGI